MNSVAPKTKPVPSPRTGAQPLLVSFDDLKFSKSGQGFRKLNIEAPQNCSQDEADSSKRKSPKSPSTASPSSPSFKAKQSEDQQNISSLSGQTTAIQTEGQSTQMQTQTQLQVQILAQSPLAQRQSPLLTRGSSSDLKTEISRTNTSTHPLSPTIGTRSAVRSRPVPPKKQEEDDSYSSSGSGTNLSPLSLECINDYTAEITFTEETDGPGSGIGRKPTRPPPPPPSSSGSQIGSSNRIPVPPPLPINFFASLQEREKYETQRKQSSIRTTLRTKDLLPNPLLPGELVISHLQQIFEVKTIINKDQPGGIASTSGTMGMLFLTNFQLIFYSGTSASWAIPLAAIEKIKKPGYEKVLAAKDLSGSATDCYGFVVWSRFPFQTRLLCHNRAKMIAFQKALEDLVFISVDQLYAFAHGDVIKQQQATGTSFGWEVYNSVEDYHRLGLDTGRWKIVDINKRYEFCETYPALFVVPSAVANEQLLQSVASYRSKKRIPAVVWRYPSTDVALARCSQPLSGLMGNRRCKEDEKLFKALTVSNRVTKNELYVIDCRPAVNAYANQLKGAGTENKGVYKKCGRIFLNIENIHVMRSSQQKLHRSVMGVKKGDFKEDRLESAGWLEHLGLVLSGAVRVASLLHGGASVVVHCSDGWDRTPQLVALAEIMLDPYYRTIIGFEVLIEKEWLSFGHMFHLRIGRGDKIQRKKERSQTAPIFVQFIECVWQMCKQFPSAFQFNEYFLITILFHLYSGQYGTFFCNSEKQREELGLKQNTCSVWSVINSNPQKFTNPDYKEIPNVANHQIDLILPSCDNLQVWPSYYLAEHYYKL